MHGLGSAARTDSPVSDDDFAKEMEAIYGPLREELEKLKETGDPAFTACCDKLITYMVETKIAIVKQDVWGLHSMKSKAPNERHCKLLSVLLGQVLTTFTKGIPVGTYMYNNWSTTFIMGCIHTSFIIVS